MHLLYILAFVKKDEAYLQYYQKDPKYLPYSYTAHESFSAQRHNVASPHHRGYDARLALHARLLSLQ